MTCIEEVDAEELERKRQQDANWDRYRWEWTSPAYVEKLEKNNKNKD